MEPLIAGFDARNADDIARRAAYWKRVREQAAILGWARDKPYGDLTNNPLR